MRRSFQKGGGKTYQKYQFPVGQHKNGTGYWGRVSAGSRSRNSSLTRKLSPELSPNTLRLKLTRLKPLKIVERVKGIEPSLSAWEANESEQKIIRVLRHEGFSGTCADTNTEKTNRSLGISLPLSAQLCSIARS